MTTDEHPPPTARPGGVRTTRRRGRTTPGHADLLAGAGRRWTISELARPSVAALAEAYGRSAPVAVDIGVGDGRATTAWAAEQPRTNVLAIELHRPGVVKLVRSLEADGPPNVRVIEGDALAVLDRLDERSITAIRVLFPDPWPKRRHVTRRIVDRAFVTRVGDLLVDGGELHLATDWADYADHMRSMVATDPRFVEQLPGRRPPRPVTAYEQRGLDAGRTIADLVFRLNRSLARDAGQA